MVAPRFSRRSIVGLISDTHGLTRPEALGALRGSDIILHAGDIGRPEILAELRALAPVTVVRGNIDKAAWAEAIPATEVVDAGQSVLLYMLHNLEELDLDPVAAGFHAVVYGHSHKPGVRWKDGVLYVNPGSAGPRRFSLPVTVGRLIVDGGGLSAEILDLGV